MSDIADASGSDEMSASVEAPVTDTEEPSIVGTLLPHDVKVSDVIKAAAAMPVNFCIIEFYSMSIIIFAL